MTTPEVTLNVPTLAGWLDQMVADLPDHRDEFADADDSIAKLQAHLREEIAKGFAQAEYIATTVQAVPGFEQHTADAIAVIRSVSHGATKLPTTPGPIATVHPLRDRDQARREPIYRAKDGDFKR